MSIIYYKLEHTPWYVSFKLYIRGEIILQLSRGSSLSTETVDNILSDEERRQKNSVVTISSVNSLKFSTLLYFVYRNPIYVD